MIKSFSLTPKGMTCYKIDGTVFRVSSDNLPPLASIKEMMDNIRLNGCTEFIGLNLSALSDILEGFGFKAVKVEDDLYIPHENGNIQVKPLENLIRHAHVTDNGTAITALLNRIASVDRQHSKEDLVKFIEKSSMPVTNDGRMVAFKRVQKINGNNYDCHTNTILNNVGCRVVMDIDKVDPDRTRECSYGLHVASRPYLKSFTGNTLLLILVNPEDVIAVPQYDPHKVRVCQYDVVHEFTEEQARHIMGNEKLNDEVWQIIKPYIEGTKYTIDKVVKGTDVKSETIENSSESDTETQEKYFNEVQTQDSEIASQTVKAVKNLSNFQRLLNLFENAEGWADQKSRFIDLQLLKRKQKKSWTALGATQEQAKKLDKFAERVK